MKNLLIKLGLIVVLTGCAATSIKPNAVNVVASPNPAPNNCKLLGQVVGNQGGTWSGGFYSSKNLTIGVMNDLKNETADMGGNYVQIINNNYNNINAEMTTSGNAYICPNQK